MKDLNLFQGINKGNYTSFDQLFKLHFEPLCKYAYGIYADRDIVQEVVVDIFTNIWEKRGSLIIPDHPKAYLYQSVRNNIIRKKGEQQQFNEELSDVFISTDFTIQEQMVFDEMEHQFKSELHQLPTRTKEVFLLKREEEMSYKEIAQLMNISVSAVEKHMINALKHFRTKLQIQGRKSKIND
ncbi:RNA polymerase sigma-70 factor [Flammeovirga yaeyamensis]|uniref:RNA polymerase sigma-70 factor n=1 Tax=Flammeovirga yaeyamensis TaxID=367791 RepID=A0AAX1N865_9BACT|nr:RNA polymerase sigma-70 factor [Flammeovirga yaeyamensis]MBB3700562.1 RNA polymerase sigma-70 factor (ECF subfamily) [Flammeovirga yaeyamensis]NMF37679.1 RNA polymerase sigma-70 factor [Flammeovirga yaeyamensis]QWG01988.1 RNA polymerase sigma-70 factor [Flammeovirga yaeyamensis]